MSVLQTKIVHDSAATRHFEMKPARRDARFTATARAWADFWIGSVLMRSAARWPGMVNRVKPYVLALTWLTTKYLQGSLVANARRILGEDAGSEAHCALGKAVLANFYDCICDIADASRCNHLAMEERVGDIVGRERYLEVRAQRRGAILVTAHLGAFETAVTALRRDEHRVHIVFRRDPMQRFERLRAAQRKRLGVIEAPVDDGLAVWMTLRDALLNDEVVLMQGDRVMPGQSGACLPFFNGHMLFPTGPVKLAMMTGSPLVPIFAPRRPDGRVQIILEEPISMSAQNDGAPDAEHALMQLAAIIEKTVRAYPEQWLIVQRAFCEDLHEAP